MDFLKKAEGMMNQGGNNNQAAQQGGAIGGGQGGAMGGAMGGQGQAMGNNQNEDYGDKGLFFLPASDRYCADQLDPQDLTSSKRRPDTRWVGTRTRRSLMEREGYLRRLLGESSFFFGASLRSQRRGNMKGNLIRDVLHRKQVGSKYSN